MSAICGLVGRCAREEQAMEGLGRMLTRLKPRGPDSGGAYCDIENGVALGWRWLRTAPDEVEPQVFTNEDESLRMICDGRVFNASDVAAFLKGRGHTLATDCSGEVLLHLFEEEGASGWRRVDGQFAVAIWSRNRQELILGRDFLGVRGMYFWPGPHGVIFSSEIKSLLGHPDVPRDMDPFAVSNYLTFLTTPVPRTLFANIRKLEPGSVGIVQMDGAVRVERYWDLLQDPIPEREDERFYVEGTRNFHEASAFRRKQEGPIGSLLSGGNDSSANAALLARFGCKPLHTFTVGLADFEAQPRYSDMQYARKVAEHIGSEHHEYYLSTDEFLKTIAVTVEAMDEMVSEPSSPQLYHALRMVRDQGLSLVITGEANDELTCGHGAMIRIRDQYYRKWLPFRRQPAWIRHPAAWLGSRLWPARREVLRRAVLPDSEYFWNFEIGWMPSEKQDVLTQKAWEQCRTEDSYEVVQRYASRFRASEHSGRNYLNYIIYIMMQDYYFGNLMLSKLELLAGSLGIEARCPYTEPAYAHFVYNVPAGFKTKGGLVKYFFKKSIEGLLPDSIIYRPKQGFRTPVVELFRGALGDWAKPVLMEQGLSRNGFLRREHLAELLKRHRAGPTDFSARLWTAMAINLWYERWISPGPVAESPIPLRRKVDPDGSVNPNIWTME